MPTCPQCGVTYLPGERHECAGPKRSFLLLLGVAAGGALLGAVAGYMALVLIVCAITQANLCGLYGVFLGLPGGAVAGGVVAVRLVNRPGPRKR